MKKPELYTQQRRYGNDDIRVSINPNKFAVWNSTYYRANGKRKAYSRKLRKQPSRLYDNTFRYQRWQLDYDLAKPWHVACTYPKDFATIQEALAYAFSMEAKEGPYKWNLNERLIQVALEGL